MIVRDAWNIVVQHDAFTKHLPRDQWVTDAGDSARSTGLMAMCGSEIDLARICLFPAQDGLVRRHPFDDKYKDPKLMSRDQLDCYIAGLAKSIQIPLSQITLRIRLYWARKVFYAYAKKFFFVNSDVLLPDRIGSMLLAGRIYWLYPLLPISYAFLVMGILWGCYVNPSGEQNQLVARCYTHGKVWVWLLAKLHPDLAGNLKAYFSGWRDQSEIGEMLLGLIPKYSKLKRRRN